MSLRSCIRSPLFWILTIAGLLRIAGLAWGMPASDGWDDDGFAPRNFLTALALTYKPGSYFTYPPLHAFLLTLLTWPGIAWALAHAHSLTQGDVVREFTGTPYMTFFVVMARLVSAAMSLGIIACAGQMAALIAGRRAGIFAAAACALNVALTYYGQVTNLDVPYLFWCMLSLLFCMQAIAWHEPARFWQGALFAAAAMATKDQAYAVFLASLPALILLWFIADAWPRSHSHEILLTLLLSFSAALFALLLVDGAVTNPSGFAKRVAFLTGPASQDYAIYQHSGVGRWRLLQDMGVYYTRGIALLATALAVLGLVLHAVRFRENKVAWVAGWLPFLAIVSFTLCFNLMALRTDDRFVLPQAVLAAIYAGIAIERAVFSPWPWFNHLARGVLAAAGLYALYQCTAVDAAMLGDPRYDAERWMSAHLRPGDTVETYGQNAYLPRFPPDAAVTRIGPTPFNRRNPLPHMVEHMEPFGSIAERNPRFIVISSWWARNYLDQSKIPPETGRVIAKVEQQRLLDRNASAYLTTLENGALDYRLAHVSRYAGTFWPAVHIHESLDESIEIFERKPAGP